MNVFETEAAERPKAESPVNDAGGVGGEKRCKCVWGAGEAGKDPRILYEQG